MKAKIVIAILFSACYVGQPAISQVVHFGNSDCGEWVANSKTNFLMKYWLVGFMSGLNSGLSTPKNDALEKIKSPSQIFLWMDNFCSKNPLQTVSEGGNELFNELRRK